MTYTELASCAGKGLEGKLESFVRSYVEAVRLDPEAKRVIERVRKGRLEGHKMK